MNTQENQQLVIRDSGLLWRIGGLLIAIVSGAALIFWPSHSQLNNIFEWVAIIVGVLILLFYGNLVITANRSTRTLRLDDRYLLFHSARVISFDDIETIHVEKSRSSSHGSSSTSYRIAAKLKDGKSVPFRLSYSEQGDKARQAARLMSFINHKTPFRGSKAAPQTAQAASSDHPDETGGTDQVPASGKT